jgi:hypothetical protein
MDDTDGFALSDRHVEGIGYDAGVQRTRHRPANDAAAEDVEHDGEIEEAGPRWNVGDIGHPQAVGRLSDEVALDEIGCRARIPIADRGRNEAPAMHAEESVLVHEPSDALSPNADSMTPQLCMDARPPVGIVRHRVDAEDHAREFVVGDLPG